MPDSGKSIAMDALSLEGGQITAVERDARGSSDNGKSNASLAEVLLAILLTPSPQ
jgi:hypothetical protein